MVARFHRVTQILWKSGFDSALCDMGLIFQVWKSGFDSAPERNWDLVGEDRVIGGFVPCLVCLCQMPKSVMISCHVSVARKCVDDAVLEWSSGSLNMLIIKCLIHPGDSARCFQALCFKFDMLDQLKENMCDMGLIFQVVDHRYSQ